MNTVTLKTGKTVPEAIVITTMRSLRSLMESDLITFFKLVELCKDSKHELWGEAGEKLKALSLIQTDGSIHADVREVVLASVESVGMGLTLVSPVAETNYDSPLPTQTEATEENNLQETEESQTAWSEEAILQSDFYDPELHRLAHRIVDVIFEHADLSDEFDDNKPRLIDERFGHYEDMFYGRRSEGFILCLDFGKPMKMFTPWGIWTFASNDGMNCSYQKAWETVIAEKLTKQLGLTEAQPEKPFTNIPLPEDVDYAINKVDDVALLSPRDLGFDEMDEEAEAVWNYLQAKFQDKQ